MDINVNSEANDYETDPFRSEQMNTIHFADATHSNDNSKLAEPISPSKNSIPSSDMSNVCLNPKFRNDVYQQFDQLVNKNMNDGKRTRRIANNNIRRDRIKSFIEFEDESEDEGKKYSYRNSIQSSIVDREYQNDLINVFQQNIDDNDSNPTINHFENNDEKEKNHEEWNDFQSFEVMLIKNASMDAKENNFRKNQETNHQQLSLVCEPSGNEIDKYSENSNDVSDTESNLLYGKLTKMEQEQELLNNSLVALTSHFAQVQLRLRQIVEAKDIDMEKREVLLAELETFANRGIPELMLATNSISHLERSASLATSLMADDVFEDENENNPEMDHENKVRPRSSGSCSQIDYDSSMNLSLKCNSTSMLITEEKLERQRNRQKELITQLKEQLEDLERYAYETGELNSLPSSMLLERQSAIIEQLKSKLPILSIDEIDQLTPEELRRKVDCAVKELVNPVIMKEQLVSQLKTQVTDLERFIEFLQQGGGKFKKYKNNAQTSSGSSYFKNFLKKNSRNDQNFVLNNSSKKMDVSNNDNDIEMAHKNFSSASRSNNDLEKNLSPKHSKNNSSGIRTKNKTNNVTEAANIFKRILSLLHVFTWTQLGTCSSFVRYDDVRTPFEQNLLKKTTTSCSRHWGDLRAKLEMAITAILDFYKEQNLKNPNTNGDEDFITLGNTALVIDNYFSYEQMTILVRKELAIALRNLMQHGLIGCWIEGEQRSAKSLTNTTTVSTNTVGNFLNLSLGCFSTRNTPIIKSRPMHAWELIVYYYELKNGSKFRSTPTRRLSQSFGLQVVSGLQANPKHKLLAAIDDIIDSHTRLKRSLDAHFKAFVSTGLNQQMLSRWLRLIFRNPTIVNDCYEKWSYAASTGFEDALRQLDKLSNLRFCLPTDLAVRQLQSIHDAF